MESFLFAHEAELRLYLFLGAFASFAMWETFTPRRPPVASTGLRWLNNIGLLSIGIVVAAWLLPALAVGSALLAQERGWGILNVVPVPTWLAFVVTFLFIDLLRYLQHVLLHRAAVLWRLHRVHHMDLDMDCSTSVRFHPVEIVLTLASYFLLLIALGAMPLAVLVAETVFIVSSMFTHTNTMLPPKLERWLRLVVVTPEMHRIHHSAHALDHDRNFGGIFSWWDRIFHTYQREPSLGHDRIVFGLSAESTATGEKWIGSLLLTPFRRE